MLSENIQLQPKLNVIMCIDKRFPVKNSGMSCLTLIFDLSNPKMRTLHVKIGSRLRHMRHMTNHIPFFSVGGYEPMALWLRRVAVSWATWVQFQQDAESLCSHLAILRGNHEPVSALTLMLYIAALCIIFIEFCHLTLYMKIRLPLFLRTWSQTRGPDSGTAARAVNIAIV